MIFTAAVLALAFGSMACGGGPKLKSDIDSLSYAIGVDLGLNVKFGVKDLELDQKIVLDNLKEFMKSGDIESEEFMKDMQFIHLETMLSAKVNFMYLCLKNMFIVRVRQDL